MSHGRPLPGCPTADRGLSSGCLLSEVDGLGRRAIGESRTGRHAYASQGTIPTDPMEISTTRILTARRNLTTDPSITDKATQNRRPTTITPLIAGRSSRKGRRHESWPDNFAPSRGPRPARWPRVVGQRMCAVPSHYPLVATAISMRHGPILPGCYRDRGLAWARPRIRAMPPLAIIGP
jgi:hypothetical protein